MLLFGRERVSEQTRQPIRVTAIECISWSRISLRDG